MIRRLINNTFKNLNFKSTLALIHVPNEMFIFGQRIQLEVQTTNFIGKPIVLITLKLCQMYLVI